MKKTQLFLIAIVSICFASCVTDSNSPGLEYMPDMYRSPAIEAYVDYGFDEFKPGMTAEMADSMRLVQQVRIPVEGTIPYKGKDQLVFNAPYPYPNTTEGYEAAGVSWKSPISTTAENIAEGKQLFETFCMQCHGDGGEGDGSITQKAGGKYPVVPSYSSRKGLEEGKMFHTITYGKGLMGSHAFILNQEERWKVIQYIKELMGDNPTVDASEENEEEEAHDEHEEHDHAEGEEHSHDESDGHEH